MREKIKIGLQNGCCCARFGCKNVNNTFCKVLPKEGEHFIYCRHYEIK